MADATYRYGPWEGPYTPTLAKSAGEIIQADDGEATVVKTDLAASEVGARYRRGIFDITSAAGVTFSAGDPVYWDASGNTAITAANCADDDFYLGTAIADKASADTTVRVSLNERPQHQRGVFSSRVVLIDHADATAHVLIEAVDNPNGLALVAFLGDVTEAMVGSSEDQLIVTLYDEDDNAIDTLTATDGAADAIGDLVVGAVSMFSTATGGIFKRIPAGKACYAKVSQATSGTPAGAFKVRAVVMPLA